MTPNSQLLYGWADGTPYQPQGEDAPGLVKHEDFLIGMTKAETSHSQLLLQQNQESNRVFDLIQQQGFITLDPGTATTTQLATEILKYQNVISNLIVQGK